VRKIPHARLAVVCRPKDLPLSEWEEFPVDRLSIVPYPSMATVLAAADVVAIPQLDIEPARYQMPMKVYDAMGMGRPIVASAMSDLPAVLQGCARLVPPGDIAALRAAIRDLLMHPEEAQALGERARALCLESFSMDRVGARLREVVRNVAPKGAV
jgi:glycosyltransferase involved in cell wall biosynthesis